MSKKFKNFITPCVKYTSITNRFLSSFNSFTVFITVRGKTSKISFILNFSAQVSQIVFSAHLTVLQLFQLYEQKLQKSHISMGLVHKYHKVYTQLTWPFYGFLQLYEVKLQKSYFSVSSVHKCHKWWSQLIWPFHGLLHLDELKLQEFHISVSSVHKYHKWCCQLILTVSRLIASVWAKTAKISFLRAFSTQVSPIVFSAYFTGL